MQYSSLYINTEPLPLSCHLLPPPSICYISWSREELSLFFCSNWMRWAEPCQCPHHLLLSRVQEEGGRRGAKTVRKGGAESSLHHGLIRQRRRPLSLYSQSRQHQRRSVWHAAKVITTLGVSLEGTNHCFTWLNGAVQRRHRLSREQSLSVALSSEGRWKKSCELIWLKCSIYMYANIWTQKQLLKVILELFPGREKQGVQRFNLKALVWAVVFDDTIQRKTVSLPPEPPESIIFFARFMSEYNPNSLSLPDTNLHETHPCVGLERPAVLLLYQNTLRGWINSIYSVLFYNHVHKNDLTLKNKRIKDSGLFFTISTLHTFQHVQKSQKWT